MWPIAVISILFTCPAWSEVQDLNQSFQIGQVLDIKDARGVLSRAAAQLEKQLASLNEKRNQTIAEIDVLQRRWDVLEERRQEQAKPLRRLREAVLEGEDEDLEIQLSDREAALAQINAQIASVEAGLKILRSNIES